MTNGETKHSTLGRTLSHHSTVSCWCGNNQISARPCGQVANDAGFDVDCWLHKRSISESTFLRVISIPLTNRRCKVISEHLTPAFSGAANGNWGTIRNLLRGLRCNGWLDAAVKDRRFTYTHHADVQCAESSVSAGCHQSHRSRGNHQLVFASLLVLSVSCNP